MCVLPQKISSPIWVLLAHHIFLDLNIFLKLLPKLLFFWVLLSENFKLPINLILFEPKDLRYFVVSLFWLKQISKPLNNLLDIINREFYRTL